MVPEAQHADSALGEKRRAPLVGCSPIGKCVLSAVDLDGDAPFLAEEVEDVGSDDHLTAKLEAAQTAIAQELPEEGLGVRRAAS